MGKIYCLTFKSKSNELKFHTTFRSFNHKEHKEINHKEHTFLHSGIQALSSAREARRPNPPTTHPNPQKYARCEWKCIYVCGI